MMLSAIANIIEGQWQIMKLARSSESQAGLPDSPSILKRSSVSDQKLISTAILRAWIASQPHVTVLSKMQCYSEAQHSRRRYYLAAVHHHAVHAILALFCILGLCELHKADAPDFSAWVHQASTQAMSMKADVHLACCFAIKGKSLGHGRQPATHDSRIWLSLS